MRKNVNYDLETRKSDFGERFGSLSITMVRFCHTLFLFYKNTVFPAQAEYSYFSADFRLKIFL